MCRLYSGVSLLGLCVDWRGVTGSNERTPTPLQSNTGGDNKEFGEQEKAASVSDLNVC